MSVVSTMSALAGVPVTPGPDEAREWAEEELAKRVYEAAEPTLIDRVAMAIGDFLDSLFTTGMNVSWSPTVIVIVLVAVAALVVLGLLIWGRPKPAHRQTQRSSLLFGEDDLRPASELRRDAEAHAAAGDWDAAIADRFRALARSLEERDVLEPLPGLTARALAGIAAEFFPDHSAGAHAGAAHFDDVRYLRRPGTAGMYAEVAAVDDAIARSRPVKMAAAFEMTS